MYNSNIVNLQSNSYENFKIKKSPLFSPCHARYNSLAKVKRQDENKRLCLLPDFQKPRERLQTI